MSAFTFIFSGIHISNTRSRHEDTDFAACALRVDGVDQGTKTKALGNLNNGDHGISNGADGGPAFGPMELADNAKVEFSYSVVNHGHDDMGANAASAAANAAITQAGPDGSNGEALKALFNTLIGFVFANCDGGVVAGKREWIVSDLKQLFGNSNRLDLTGQHNGYDSDTGCGSNSDYRSHLIILKDISPPAS